MHLAVNTRTPPTLTTFAYEAAVHWAPGIPHALWALPRPLGVITPSVGREFSFNDSGAPRREASTHV